MMLFTVRPYSGYSVSYLLERNRLRMSAIPLDYINAVAAVGYRKPDKTIKYTGSGFVYGIDARESEDDEQSYYSFIIMNRHVVEQLDKPFVRQSYLPTVERPEWTNVRGDCPREL